MNGRVAFAKRGVKPNEPSLTLLDTATGKQLGQSVPAPKCDGTYPTVNCSSLVFATADPSVVVLGVQRNGLMTVHGYSVSAAPAASKPAFTLLWTLPSRYLSPTIMTDPQGVGFLYVVGLYGSLERFDLHTGAAMGKSTLFGAGGDIGQISDVSVSPNDNFMVAVPNTWHGGNSPDGPQLLVAPSNASVGSQVFDLPKRPDGATGGYVAWQSSKVVRVAASNTVFQAVMDGDAGRPTQVSQFALPMPAISPVQHDYIVGLAAGRNGSFVAWGVNAIWQVASTPSDGLAFFRLGSSAQSTSGLPIDTGVIAEGVFVYTGVSELRMRHAISAESG